MKIGKAIFCTAVITAMLIVIMVGLALLKFYIAFAAIAAAFAIVGVAVASGALFVWLAHTAGDDEDLPPIFQTARKRPVVKVVDPVEQEPEEERIGTLEEIIEGVRGE